MEAYTSKRIPFPLSYCKFTATVKITRLKNLQGHIRQLSLYPSRRNGGVENIIFALFHIQKDITMVKSFSGLWHCKVTNSDNPAQSKGQDLCQESTSISGSVTGGLCDLQWRAAPLFLQPLLVHRETIAFCYAPK